MKVRIKFSKQGPLKFVGHLDIMRYFQKSIRRADIPIRYSEGFSPHQIMSFAAPLGLGLTSNGEYMDIELTTNYNCSQLKEELSQVMAEGIQIISCQHLKDSSKNAMSVVAAADYTVGFRKEYLSEPVAEFLTRIPKFYLQPEISVIKQGKKTSREINIRPFIYQLSVESDHKIFMKLASGSENNIKPELVLKSYYEFLGREMPEFALLIQREEVYANTGDLDHPVFTPLEKTGVEVE